MTGALQAVCALNHQPTARKSWRHGSIDWRIEYLRSLEGLPVEGLPIDRTVHHITWACSVLFIAAIALSSLG